MEDRLVVLPSQEELYDRLVLKCAHADFRRNLYPSLLREAGKSWSEAQVVVIILHRLFEYSLGKAPSVAAAALTHMPSLIEALIPDESAATQVKEFWQEVLSFR